ncbi:MAG: hypothetical protein KGO51_02855 [Alphaproteobacteria bacterium]|nr:hypothetical protein [Alphaproteobacteria bacterium]
MSRVNLALAAFAGLALLPGCAAAADEEIQVYMDEMNPKGVYGLDLHLNYVPQGRAANVDYAGQMASDGRFRFTPEWSYGLTDNVELGLYLPLATLDRNGDAELGGVKGRVKWIAPRSPGQDWFWGANLEIGRVRRSLDINPWNAELKGILGVRQGPWTLAANLNADWAVSGPDKGPVTYQLATKASYKVAPDTALGLESYNSLGSARRFGRLSDNDQEAFVVLDQGFGRWDLDFGVGRGWGAPEDQWIVKAIIGVPID